MNAAVLGFVVVALVVGGIIGWLLGSRAAAGAKQTVESLRLQLDEVVKERDVNREAATDLAALKAAQEEREKRFSSRSRRWGQPRKACPRSSTRSAASSSARRARAFLSRRGRSSPRR